MNKRFLVAAAPLAMLMLAGCHSGPKPGQPRPQEADSSTQALAALYGGPKPVSQGEAALLQAAGPAAQPGIRSEAGADNTTVVNKGQNTQQILKAPPTTDNSANATVPK
jgi:outer membrane murein-binding lipoprotein Lpp